MKQYLLFSGDAYYPGGGWNDFRGSFDTIEEATATFNVFRTSCSHDWYHIVDSVTLERVV